MAFSNEKTKNLFSLLNRFYPNSSLEEEMHRLFDSAVYEENKFWGNGSKRKFLVFIYISLY